MTDTSPDSRPISLRTPSEAVEDMSKLVGGFRDGLQKTSEAIREKRFADAADGLDEALVSLMGVNTMLALIGVMEMPGKKWAGLPWWKRLYSWLQEH